LKRLTSAANPESATTTYGYDNNGNLTTKTDPKENVQGGGTLITIEPTAVNSNGTRYTTSSGQKWCQACDL
jgi:YD repeat-containing protein